MRYCLWTAAFALFSLASFAVADEQANGREAVTIGAVGRGDRSQVFENLIAVLAKKGYPAKYVLYSNYDALVDALDNGEIDIAWNSPMAHAQFHVRNQCQSQTLAMREGDIGLRVTLITSAESGIQDLNDLKGKRVIIGRQKYHEGMLSAHFLKKQIAEFDRVEIVQLPEKGADGKRTDTTTHIMHALADGRGDAAVVPLRFWKRSVQWRRKNPQVVAIWESPSFNHCVFTAAKDFEPALGRQFTELMTTLDPDDPLVAELNRLEGTRKWLPGDAQGFESLVEAIQESGRK